MASDDGYAVHYTELKRGTPVRSSDGQEVGTVAEVLDNDREAIFDGLVIETPSASASSWTRQRWSGRPSAR